MERRISSEYIVFLCRLMQLIHQFGTLALRTLLVKYLFVKYIQTRRANFTYFADEKIVVKEHWTKGSGGCSAKYRVPNPLPDIKQCVKDSKDGEGMLEFIEESFLTEIVNDNMTKLADLKKKNIMNKAQWETLFSNATVNIHDLDLSLLSLLLFNLFNLRPTVDMKTRPLSCNITEGDDVLRLRMSRNKIAHLHSLEITAKEFEDMWRDISCAIIRLLGSTFQSDVNRLKITNFDEAAVTRYNQLRKEWSENVTDIYQSLSDIKEELRSIKKKPRHRKGPAIQLAKSDDIQRALAVLLEKGITAKVIFLDETDRDSTESVVETVPKSFSKSTGCLQWAEYLDGENTIRATRSSTNIERETLRAKEKANPFYVMFPGSETTNTTNNQTRRWSTSDSSPEFSGQPTVQDYRSMPSTSSCDSQISLFEDDTESAEHPKTNDGPVYSTYHSHGFEIHQQYKAPEMEPKTKKKSFWRSFKGLF